MFEKQVVNNVIFDPLLLTISIGSQPPIYLTVLQWRLLLTLAADPEKAWTRAEIHQRLTGQTMYMPTNAIDVQIYALRKLIHPEVIITVRSAGYRFGSFLAERT